MTTRNRHEKQNRTFYFPGNFAQSFQANVKCLFLLNGKCGGNKYFAILTSDINHSY